MQGGRVALDARVLRQLRQARRLSQEELAAACERQQIRVSVSTIKRAECGRPVLYRIARELARFFDVPVAQLGSGTTAIAGRPPPAIGRAHALAQCASVVADRLLQGRGTVVVIEGEPGMGKTHLLTQCMALARQWQVNTACQSIRSEGGWPWYHPLLGIVRVLTGLQAADAPLDADSFAQLCRQCDLDHEDSLHLAFFFGQALSPALRVVQDNLDYAARQAGQNRLLLRLFERYGQPILIAIEDVHWADLHLLLVLRHIADGIGQLPVMIVLTSRPEPGAWQEVWGSGMMNTHQLTVRLQALDATESTAFADQFGQLPAQFRTDCIALADGNPLFLSQLLLDYGSGASAQPQSIRNHILHKLAQLAGADRDAIEAAAVLGERFSMAAVRFITADATYAGTALAMHHLIGDQRDGMFSFCHALIQQSVYTSLAPAQQRHLHGRAADWYRARHPVLYARHLDQADRLGATDAYFHAASAMYEQRNYVDALTLVDQSLHLLANGAERYAPVLLKARLLKLLNLPEKSILHLLEAAELAPDQHHRCDALCELAEAYLAVGRHADAQELLVRIDALLAAAPDRPGQRVRIRALRCQLGLDSGAPAGAMAQMVNAAGLQASLAAMLRDLPAHRAATPETPAFPGQPAAGNPGDIVVGVLHSQTGFLRELEAGVLRATLLAFQEINDQGGLLGRRIHPLLSDGRSSETVFMEQAAHLIGRDDVVTVFGCSTSSSRRRVRPLIDDNEHLLVYPFQHEGIEASPHIAYVGPAPNQQALPAVDWLVAQGHATFLLVGSDYVYPVLTNDVLADRIAHHGGTVLDTQYFGMGCRDFTPAIAAIAQLAPAALILTIVGLESNFALLQQLHRAQCPRPTLLSLVLSEDDLANIPLAYTTGIYTVFSYFQNIDHPLNQDFVRRYRQRFGDRSRIGGYMESAYVGVFLWAKAVQKAGCLDRRAIKLAMKGISHVGPGGLVYMDEEHNYVWRHVRVAQVGRDGEYHVAWNSPRPVRPEPYPANRTIDAWQAYIRALRERWGGRWESPH